jgi:hypothetical protein
MINQRREVVFSLMLFALLMMIAACGNRESQPGGNQILGSEQTLSGQATLSCSQDCLDRAQCGMTEQVETVLLSTFGPATTGHDLAFPAGTAVIIDHQEMQPAIQVSDQSSIRVPFYLVNVPEVGSGWVAGWCLSQQVPDG